MVHSFLGCSPLEARCYIVRKQGARHKESPGRGPGQEPQLRFQATVEHQLAGGMKEPTGDPSPTFEAVEVLLSRTEPTFLSQAMPASFAEA